MRGRQRTHLIWDQGTPGAAPGRATNFKSVCGRTSRHRFSKSNHAGGGGTRRTLHFSLSSSKAEHAADNRKTVERYHAQGPLSLDGRVSQCTRLKSGRSRCDSGSSGQFSNGGQDVIVSIRHCECRRAGAIPVGLPIFYDVRHAEVVEAAVCNPALIQCESGVLLHFSPQKLPLDGRRRTVFIRATPDFQNARVAQLYRVLRFERSGCRLESCREHHFPRKAVAD